MDQFRQQVMTSTTLKQATFPRDIEDRVIFPIAENKQLYQKYYLQFGKAIPKDYFRIWPGHFKRCGRFEDDLIIECDDCKNKISRSASSYLCITGKTYLPSVCEGEGSCKDKQCHKKYGTCRNYVHDDYTCSYGVHEYTECMLYCPDCVGSRKSYTTFVIHEIHNKLRFYIVD